MHECRPRLRRVAAVPLLLLAACNSREPDTVRVHEQTLAMSGQQVLRADVSAGAGTYRLSLLENGVDARLQIERPVPYRAAQAEGTLRRHGTQSALLTLAAPSTLRIQIVGRDFFGKRGSVVLALDRLADSRRAQAEKLMAHAYEHIAAGSQSRLREALQLLLDASTSFVDAGEPGLGAQSRLEAARLSYARLDDWEGAARHARNVSDFAAGAGEEVLAARARALHAAALMELAQSDNALRLQEEAESLLQDACAVFAERRLELDLAECVNNLGLLNDYRGTYAAAATAYRRAAQLFATAGDEFGVVKATQNVATVEYRSGHLSAAIESYQAVLARIDRREQTDLYSAVVSNLASASALRGDYQRAIELHTQALTLYRELDHAADEARALQGLGSTYYLAGDLDQALRFFEQALVRQLALKDRGVRVSLLSMGNVLADLGRYAQARRRFEQAAQYATSDNARSQVELALANLEIQEGAWQAGRERLERLLPKLDDPVARARASAALARIDVATGKLAAARTTALAAAQVLERHELGTAAADAYATVAQAQIESGAMADAVRWLDRAMRLAGERRRRIWSADLRASNVASQRRLHDLRLRVLEKEPVWDAFWTADGFKAQSLLEVRAATRAAGNSQAADRAEKELRLSELQLRVDAQAAILGAADPRVVALVEEIRALRLALDAAPAGWRSIEAAASPANAALRARLRTALPADGTVLAYHLGAARSYAWVIRGDAISQVDLAPREQIAAAARRLSATLREPAAGATAQCGAALARLVLLPVERLLGGERLWVVPDAELHEIPFAALPSGAGTDCRTRLIDRFTVTYLPSVRSALADDRLAVSAGARNVAILADPVFSTDLLRDLPRLPATADEARMVATQLHGRPVKLLLGAQATRAQFLGLPFEQLAVLHLATHAQVRSATPELSALYFSGVDGRGSRVPSQVTVADIRRYRARAQLVVLSACETSLGRVLDGEGFIGLTHAFLGAGARTVVATDWQVADRATADLMRAFYVALAKGSAPAHALAVAQRTARSNPGAPGDDWAAFRVVESYL